MRLSDEHIKQLQSLLKELNALDYSDEQAQEAGVAIIRFMIAKNHRKQKNKQRGEK